MFFKACFTNGLQQPHQQLGTYLERPEEPEERISAGHPESGGALRVFVGREIRWHCLHAVAEIFRQELQWK